MSTGYPKFTHSAKYGESGVALVSRIVFDTFDWLFKRNHQEHDFGIDGQIELVTDEGAVTGQMIAVQIKYGKSFFQEQNRWGYVYRGETKHFNYLANYPIPVIICICDPDTEQCYWAHFQVGQAQVTARGWKLTIPVENTLASSKAALHALVPRAYDSLAKLEPYWALNKVIVEASFVHYILDKSDVRASDVSRPRDFFDRLRVTKELAYECQGKVDISFLGYEDDPRGLFEIEEVRNYVELLDAALPELFFFVRTELPAATLKTFAYCQADVSWEDDRSTCMMTKQLTVDMAKVATFLERHFFALNEMTKWLGMSVEENKKVSHAILRCFGFIPPAEGNGA